jgi:uncharacterized circularly permuted ATP-grasp superfamily protein
VVAATVHPIRMPQRLAEYEPLAGCYDEAFAEPGVPRPAYSGLLACLEEGPPGRIAAELRAELEREGVRFRSSHGDAPFLLDPLPRLLSAAEHEALAAGLAQRARALDAFTADAHAERRIVAAGLIPERVIGESELYEPAMQGVEVPGGVFAHVAGPDVVRGPDGRFNVLEDNLRSPSGLAYALAARRAVALQLPLPRFEPLPLEAATAMLRRTLVGAAPPGAEGPHVVLLCDGPAGAAWYEHRALAALLGVPALTPADLRLAGGRLRARGEHGEQPVEVIYRRTAEERLTAPDGRPNQLGELLIEPIRSGAVSVVNAFGSGVADDKLAHAYVDAMIRFYLGTEPLLSSVPTYDLGEPEARGEVLERLGEMVVKSRGGLGGAGVRMLSGADRGERDDVAAMIRRDPGRHIAQAQVPLSTHPTLNGERLEPRRVDLRPFLFATGGGYEMAPAALTRYARSVESMHVNSSQGGGGKDTWTLP